MGNDAPRKKILCEQIEKRRAHKMARIRLSICRCDLNLSTTWIETISWIFDGQMKECNRGWQMKLEWQKTGICYICITPCGHSLLLPPGKLFISGRTLPLLPISTPHPIIGRWIPVRCRFFCTSQGAIFIYCPKVVFFISRRVAWHALMTFSLDKVDALHAQDDLRLGVDCEKK